MMFAHGELRAMQTRLLDLGEGSGKILCEADSAEEAYAWAYNWTSMCHISLKPVLTDEESRRIINKQPRQPHVPLKPIKYNDPDGTIYMGTWKIHDKSKLACFELFGAMSPDQDKADTGPNNKNLIRVCDMGEGTGCCIFQSKSPADAYTWCYNWTSMGQFSIKPMLTDPQARAIIAAKKK